MINNGPKANTSELIKVGVRLQLKTHGEWLQSTAHGICKGYKTILAKATMDSWTSRSITNDKARLKFGHKH